MHVSDLGNPDELVVIAESFNYDDNDNPTIETAQATVEVR